MCSLKETDERLLLTGYSSPVSRNGESPEYFSIAPGEASAHFSFTPGLHIYFHYSDTHNKSLKKAFVIKGVRILSRSTLARSGYVQRACIKWREDHCSQLHSCLSLGSQDLSDSIAFSITELFWVQKMEQCLHRWVRASRKRIRMEMRCRQKGLIVRLTVKRARWSSPCACFFLEVILSKTRT